MPLYEYQCQECDHQFELIQKFSDDPITKCESCDGPVKKLISAPGIHFKGSGFYINDYARKGQPKEGGSEGGADSKKDDSKKSESATATKDASGSSKDGKSSKDSSSSTSTTSSTSSTTKSESKPKSSK